MSNDIELIKSQLANIPRGLDDDTKAVAGGSMFSKRISIKGGVFRKFSGGKEVGVNDERHMNVIFVKMAHNPARTYYPESYVEGRKIAPLCWSSDSKTPDEGVASPQAPSCNECQFSVKGSAAQGEGTACRLSWRTAVVLPNDPSGDVLQLVLPATSVWGDEQPNKLPFKAYMRYLAGHNISAGRVVTRMAFDTSIPAPTLRFSAASAVPIEDHEAVIRQSQSAAAEVAVKLTVFQQDEGSAPAQPAAVPAVSEASVGGEASVPATAESVPEPVLVKTDKPAAPAEDVADIVKKWSRKAK